MQSCPYLQVSNGWRMPTLALIIPGLQVTSVLVLPHVKQEGFGSQCCGTMKVPPILGGEVVWELASIEP